MTMFKFDNGNNEIQKMYTTFEHAILRRQKIVVILVFNYMIGLLCIEILQKIHESNKQNLTPCTIKKYITECKNTSPLEKRCFIEKTRFYRKTKLYLIHIFIT